MATPDSERLIGGLDREEASRRAGEIILRALHDTLRERSRFRLVVTGGRTPIRLYELLARSYAPWKSVDWFWSDERAVPPDHPDSNYGLVHKHLLSRCDHDPERVFRMPGEVRPLGRAAAQYEAMLDSTVLDGVFDLTLLGMGEDGHIASLFPGHPQVAEDGRAVVFMSDAPKPPPERISLALPWLARSRKILVLTSGKDRESIVRSVLEDPEASRARWPVALLPPDKTTFVVIDERK